MTHSAAFAHAFKRNCPNVRTTKKELEELTRLFWECQKEAKKEAAPDLLAALEGLIISVEPFETKLAAAIGNATIPSMVKARAAIAKARPPKATSPYLNKPLRTVEQAMRDSEGES